MYIEPHAARTAHAPAAAASEAAHAGPAPAPFDYGSWLLLSAMGSFMLLGVTNHITHDVASVPFLWILPLTLYLLSIILCFEGRGWYQRHLFLGPPLVVVCAMAWALHSEVGLMDMMGGASGPQVNEAKKKMDEALKNMTPEQRQMIERMMKQQRGGSQ